MYGKDGLTWATLTKVAGLNEPIGCTKRSWARRMESEVEELMREIEDITK